MGDRSLTLDVTEETVAGLERLARETGRSPAELANEAVQRFVEYESWKADKIECGLRAADAGDFATDEEMAAVFDRYRHAADGQ
jgi:RHH-type rel operon transcriptional repressor/antitoxin RelB